MSRRGTIALHLALAASCFVAVYWHAGRVFDLQRKNYGEGTTLAWVERWRTEPISPRWLDGPRCTLTPYAPGYYLAVKLLSPLTPWDHTLIPGRLINLFAMLAIAALAAFIVHRLTQSWAVGQAGALVFMLCPVVTYWVPFHRVDCLAVFFALAAYAACGPRSRDLVLSAVLIVLGSLFKQTAALAALPILLHLVLNNRRRDACCYFLLLAAMGAAAWGLLAWMSDGYLLSSAIRGTVSRMHFKTIFHMGFFRRPLSITGLLVVVYLFVTDPAQLKKSLFVTGFLVSAVLSAVLVAKDGSDQNYFLEVSTLAAIVIAAHGLGPLWSVHRPRMAGLLVVLAVTLLLESAANFPGACKAVVAGAPTGMPTGWEDKEVLADAMCIDRLVALHKQPLINDPFAYRQMVDAGYLDPAPLVDALTGGKVGLLVLAVSLQEHHKDARHHVGSWPQAVVQAMQRYFVLSERRPGLLIYTRRPQ